MIIITTANIIFVVIIFNITALITHNSIITLVSNDINAITFFQSKRTTQKYKNRTHFVSSTSTSKKIHTTISIFKITEHIELPIWFT